ncbi:MAG TPA: riboflavin synthase [Devosiaceae bacterium]|nr:riboflavin synthase [Devosiaceae bacterium]
MFTGIVTDVGTVRDLRIGNDGREITIATAYDPQTIPAGASIACDGVCLTVTDKGSDTLGNWFMVFAALETLAVTTVDNWLKGRRVNLERSLRAGDEFGGHVVQGHVDAVARVTAREDSGDQIRFEFEAPPEVMPFIAKKGAVALNGTSLTVNAVQDSTFSVHLIPHTAAVTTWRDIDVGDKVNLEVDPMARYAARLIESLAGKDDPRG